MQVGDGSLDKLCSKQKLSSSVDGCKRRVAPDR